MSFFEELKRRNVFRVGLAYVLLGWALLQGADFTLDLVGAPEWVIRALAVVVAIGLPIALFFAWAFELTPEGIKRESEVDRSESVMPQTGRKLDRAIIAFLVLVIAIMGLERLYSPDQVSDEAEAVKTNTELEHVGAKSSKKSIAVLPFDDLSPNRDQAYFGEGIAEELLNGLVQLDDIDVASRTSTFALADDDLRIPEIAERLDVDHVLEGSIRTSGNDVRVTAQLIEVASDKHLWSETFNGTLDDIFRIQDEITGQILEQLEIQLVGAGVTPAAEALTSDPEAYRLYLQGRARWRERSIESLRGAVDLLNRAVAIDPDFTAAWANLAVAYLNIGNYDPDYGLERSQVEAKDAADRALALNPDATEALSVKAELAGAQCDHVEAEHLLRRAIETNPNAPTPRHWRALRLATLGQLQAALEEIEIARRLDPMIAAVQGITSITHATLGNYAEADASARRVSELTANPGLLSFIEIVEFLDGRRTNLSLEGNLWLYGSLMPEFNAAIQDPAQIPAFEAAVRQLGPLDSSSLYSVMEMLALLGSDLLPEIAEQSKCPQFTFFVWHDRYREQRGTAEFFELMNRSGAVAYWETFGWPDDCASLDQSLANCPQ